MKALTTFFTGEDGAYVAALVVNVSGFMGRFDLDTTKPDRTPRKLLDVSRLNVHGWHPRTSLEEELRLPHDDLERTHGVR